MTLRPLGRVMVPPVRRFDDKHPDAVRSQSIDVSAWLRLVDGDELESATVESDDLTISGVSVDFDRVAWLAAGGADGTDAEIVVTYVSTLGRTEVEIWNCLVAA